MQKTWLKRSTIMLALDLLQDLARRWKFAVCQKVEGAECLIRGFLFQPVIILKNTRTYSKIAEESVPIGKET